MRCETALILHYSLTLAEIHVFSHNIMEVEIKLRLPTKEEYLKVKALLGEPKETQHQANYYLDTVNLSL